MKLEDQLADSYKSGVKAGLGFAPDSYSDERDPSSPTESDKSTKSEANYRKADSDERCGTCSNFSPDDSSCRVVSGRINASYVSDFYKAGSKDKRASADNSRGRGGDRSAVGEEDQ